MQASDYWPAPTAHQDYWEHHNNPYVYEYDPTDDGPETIAIKAIHATHTEFELNEERADFQYIGWLIGRIVTMLRNPDVSEKTRVAVGLAAVMSPYADRIRLRGVNL